MKKDKEFIEGVHYYLENGAVVFTELYHIQRGHCCKNNCRHCAWREESVFFLEPTTNLSTGSLFINE